MATSIHVKTTGKWKPVKIDYNLLSQSDFDSLISLEELTDYELTADSILSDKRKTDKKGKSSAIKTNDDKIKKNLTDTTDRKKVKKRKKKKEILHGKDFKDVHNKSCSIEITTSEKELGLKTEQKLHVESSIADDNSKIKGMDSLESNTQKKKRKRKKIKKTEIEAASPSKKSKLDIPEDTKHIDVDKTSIGEEMTLWKDLFVPEEVLLALRDCKFKTPTHIQSLVLPHAIRDRLDIVGAAETGSGKTLAFGIPVIDKILKYKNLEKKKVSDKDGDEKVVINKGTDEDINLCDIDSESELEWESDDNLDKSNGDDDDKNLDKSDDEDDNDKNLDKSDDVDDDDDDGDDDKNFDKSDDEDDDDDDDKSDNDENEEDDDKPGNDDDHNDEDFGCVTVIDDADFSSLGLPEVKVESEQHPLALILEPTRELAIQVTNHLEAILKYTDVKVATIVGGMSLQKQQRILKKRPEIIVSTPGRLWELFQMSEPYLLNIDKIHCLVIDEADRMVEKGHFEELEKLCLHINRDEKKRKKRQNFVFSATLTMIHVGPYRPTKQKKFKLTEAHKLEKLVAKIGLKDKPKVIDLSRKTGTVETLTEARINCTREEKDLFLYYFLRQFPGRTLVFANSKDCIRRLVSIFTLLQTSPMQLHADMHQKQRLKNLEKFTANPNSLLLASDVAARGLDIPNVQHVIHYQVPLTVENYVHRSGRTARASKEGISVMLVGPDDVKNYRKIIYTLNRNEDLPIIPVEYSVLPALKQRLNLALTIDVTEHRFEKKKRQNDWFLKAAKEMDLEVDDKHLLNDLGDSREQSQHKQQIKQLRLQLHSLLQQPLISNTFSGKYPTKTGKLLLPNQAKRESDAIMCVKKDKKSQEKLIHQIDIERQIKQKTLQNKLKEKKSKRQQKRNKRKKNKES